MATKYYNKLVRDRIPDIISQNGAHLVDCSYLLDDEGYMEELENKLDEEITEFHDSKEVEELVDIMEVVYAIAELKGVTRFQLDLIRHKKASEKGGFKDRIFLNYVSE